MGTKDPFRYLNENDGIAISHSLALSMGTDWLNNATDVEPLVKIFQGDRVSNEYEDAQRAAIGSNLRSAPRGFYTAGFLWNAWAQECQNCGPVDPISRSTRAARAAVVRNGEWPAATAEFAQCFESASGH